MLYESFCVFLCIYLCFRNVSKYNYAFSDFPFPAETPDYPHHSQMAAYVRSYVKHFGLDKLIHYHTQVNEVTKAGMIVILLYPFSCKSINLRPFFRGFKRPAPFPQQTA